MAGNSFFKQYAVKADATLISQVLDAGAVPANDARLRGPEASVDPTASTNYGAAPTMSFTGLEVGILLGAIGIDGLDCTTGLEIGYVERAAGGTFEATGKKVSAAKCLIVPGVLSVAQGEDAAISYEGYAYSADGQTHPFAYAGSLPAGTPAVAEMFSLEHVKVNTVAIGKVLGFSIAFNIAVYARKAGKDLYPTAVGIDGRFPVGTIEVADMGELSDADLKGAEVDTVEFKLAKRAITGGAFAGAGDKTLTMAKAFLDITQTRGAREGDAGLTMTARARKSGATAIIVVA